MIARSARLSRRNLDALVPAIVLPVMLMALFVYVFGGAIRTGGHYVNYVVPGIILLCTGFGSATTAVGVCSDMVGGVIDRFDDADREFGSAHRTRRGKCRAKRVLQCPGRRHRAAHGIPHAAGPVEWLAVIGILLLFVLAISWLLRRPRSSPAAWRQRTASRS